MTLSVCLPQALRRKAVWGPKRTIASLLLIAFGFSPTVMAANRDERRSNSRSQESRAENRHRRQAPKARPAAPSSRVRNYRLDDEVTRRARRDPNGTTRVIVTMQPGAKLPSDLKRFVRRMGSLDIINGQVLDLPNSVIRQLERYPDVFRVHHDRPAGKENYRTAVTVGAASVRAQYGYSGAGIGVAVIDSGIATWHDDLSGAYDPVAFPYGNQRVTKFVDFVGGQTLPYDDNGHGSHVAGIIAGNGQDSYGQKRGIAPDASLIVLKVLDANGLGTISNIIAALNWIALNHEAYNIRVVNMSVGARITESYWTDPLTLATKALVDRGIVVVGASGNFGKNASGNLQYGGITAPSNAPWVLTVGATSTLGTLTRSDDIVAGFSSAGPSFIDFAAKPDLVAPGTGTVSLAALGSHFYATKTAALVDGKWSLGFKPYLALSGTSMAAPVVSGTVALMLEANPTLTPNLVKAILQYTAQRHPSYHALRQGAGFLNSLGAVRLARFYARNEVGARMPSQTVWSRQILWGNQRIAGGYISPFANAWATGVIWGAARSLDDIDNIVWGTECGAGCDNIVWGTHDANGDNIVWGTDGDDNIVWGTSGDDNIVWGTSFDGDNIVWGTNDDDNIVWGTDCGGADCDNIVWGTADDDNIVWGTADLADNIVWGTSDLDNIVWGTSAEEDVTWGVSSPDEVVFPDNEDSEPLPDLDAEFGEEPAEPPPGDPSNPEGGI
jgi:serine protease AprX